jgi:hypothetical protein
MVVYTYWAAKQATVDTLLPEIERDKLKQKQIVPEEQAPSV